MTQTQALEGGGNMKPGIAGHATPNSDPKLPKGCFEQYTSNGSLLCLLLEREA